MTTVASFGGELVRARLADFDRCNEAIAPGGSIDALHELRIEGKKLRYTIEIMVDVLPDLATPLRQLVALQEILGDLHDADVGLQMVEEQAGSDLEETRRWLTDRFTRNRDRALARWDGNFPDDARRALIDDIMAATGQGR